MILRWLIMLSGLMVLVAQTQPAVADSNVDWLAGHDAFAVGDIASALVHFTNARDRGTTGPAVHYNIAVCQYEIGDFVAARDSFTLITTRFPKMRGLAEYNVGLAERRLGNPVAAQRRFAAAWHHSIDPTIRALAASQLAELESKQPPDWYVSVSLNAGHDDNVALRDSLGLPAGVSGESPTADLLAMLRTPLRGDTGLAFESTLFAVTYPDADDFDQSELRLGIVYTWDNANWRVASGLHVAHGTLSGSSFNKEAVADVRATRYFNDESSLRTRLQYNEIRGAKSQFDGLDGSRTRIDIRYRWYRVPHALSLNAEFETNDRRDPDVSPARERLRAGYQFQITDRWELDVEASIRRSDYGDLLTPRNETLTSVSFGATYEFGKDWTLTMRYQYADNDSSDSVYSYTRNLYTIGFQRLFQH